MNCARAVQLWLFDSDTIRRHNQLNDVFCACVVGRRAAGLLRALKIVRTLFLV